VLEPGDGKSYDRDPRSIAKRAEAYLKASGMGDTAYFGPEPEFFIFDDVRWGNDMSGAFFKIDEYEAPWNSGAKAWKAATVATVLPSKAAISRSSCRQHARHACRNGLDCSEEMGIPVEVFHHEVAGAGQNEIGTKFSTLVERADWTQKLKYVVWNVANAYGKTATFMPKPIGWRQRLWHARSPVHLERRQKPVRRQRLCWFERHRFVLHRRHHQARSRFERDHQPNNQQLQAFGAWL
jgi:glutamine synthetase